MKILSFFCKKDSKININETKQEKLLRLNNESKKRILSKQERLWITDNFGLEQLVKKIYNDKGGFERIIVANDKQIIYLALKKGKQNDDGRLPRCY